MKKERTIVKDVEAKHMLVVEDMPMFQAEFARHFDKMFGENVRKFEDWGKIKVSYVPGPKTAQAVIEKSEVDLIILDHDMPEGEGTDLIKWMQKNDIKIPIITASIVPVNNIRMKNMGADYLSDKGSVITGDADEIIKKILGL